MNIKLLRNIIVVTTIVAICVSIPLFNALRIKSGLDLSYLPKPNQLLRKSVLSSKPELKGIIVDENDPFKFEFIVDRNGRRLNEAEKMRLMRYFVAGISIPASDWWVNLDPDESNRILAESLEYTEFGKTLLEQDYVLKQLSSSLTDPATPIGKAYWNRVNSEDKLVNRGSKVWIIPDEVAVSENGFKAYIDKQSLALKSEDKTKAFKQYIIPELKNQINFGEHFSELRQLYSTLILASWFKKRMFNSVYYAYLDSKKIAGIDIENPEIKKAVFDRYVQAYQKGVYDIQERIKYGENKGKLRSYFSGGNDFTMLQDKVMFRTVDETTISSALNKDYYSSFSANLKASNRYKSIVSYFDVIKDINSKLNDDKLTAEDRKEIEQDRLNFALMMVKNSIPNKTMASIVSMYLESDLQSETKTWLLEGTKIESMLEWIYQIGNAIEISNSDNLKRVLEHDDEGMAFEVAFDGRKATEIEELFKKYASFYTDTEKEAFRAQYAAEAEFIAARLGTKENESNSHWYIHDRHNKKHNEKLREYLNSLEPVAQDFQRELEELVDLSFPVTSKAKKPIISNRIKKIDSSWDKLDKETESAKKKDPDAQLTMANLLDLIGGRITFDSLSDMEEMMFELEKHFGDRVISKRSKFIENENKKKLQYRGINYSIDLGNGNVAELQLKTVAISFISDLEHDIVYKPYLMALPSPLQQAVIQYFKNSNTKEMISYLEYKMATSNDQKFLNEAQAIIGGRSLYDEKNLPYLAIDNRNFSVFYKEFLAKLSSNRPLNESNFQVLNYAVDELLKDLWTSFEANEEEMLELCRIVHDEGYLASTNRLGARSKDKPYVGSFLNEKAQMVLGSQGLLEPYRNRYERTLTQDGEQRLRVKDLGLDKLSEYQRIEFFSALGKNVESNLIMDIIESPEDHLDTTIVNVLDDNIDGLIARSEFFPRDLIEPWKEYVINKQLSEIAVSMILSDIDTSIDKNLSVVVFEEADGAVYTVRDMIKFYFYMAERPWHEFRDNSFTQFAINSNDFQKNRILLGTHEKILTKIAAIKLKELNRGLVDTDSVDKKTYDRIIASKIQVLKRFYSSLIQDSKELDLVLASLDRAEQKAVDFKVWSKSGLIPRKQRIAIANTKDYDYFELLSQENPDFIEMLTGLSSSSLNNFVDKPLSVSQNDKYGGIDLESIADMKVDQISESDKAYSQYYFNKISGLVPELISD